jgi:predicted transcriptional regulator
MISQQDSSYNIEPRHKSNLHGSSILLGIALILGISATVLSGYLATQVQTLQSKFTAITKKVEAIKPVVQNTDTSGITKQISELDKIVRSQSTKLSSNDEAIGSVKKAQEVLKKEIALFKTSQVSNNILHTGSPEAQEIGHGFLVTYLDAKPNSTGVTLSGYIVNMAYIQHSNATFKISIAGQSKLLVISQVEPSGSYGFEINFPEVPIAKANHCQIEYQNSIVSAVSAN